MKTAEFIKALADESRLRILNVLREGPLCVCELEYILDISQSNASRHLNKLKNAEIIDYIKKAQWAYYYLNKSLLSEYAYIEDIINKELLKEKRCVNDLDRLNEYKKSLLNCKDLRPLLAKQKNELAD